MNDIRSGAYIDPYDNIALRTPAGNWQIWATDESSSEERFMFHPEPRKIDAMVMMFVYIADIEGRKTRTDKRNF
jgi:hypothetical protein